MRLTELLTSTEHKLIGGDTEITAVTNDSRKVTKGSLFVAVRGYQTDGHAYIEKAIEKGAAAILCEEPVKTDVPCVVCADTRRALAEVGALFYGEPSKKLKIIGVTGTNGKTTTTYLIKQILDLLGYKTGLIGTNQNIIGDEILPAARTTPESIDLQKLFRDMVEKGVTHVIMEVSSHSLALSRTHGIVFHEAVFTNLTQDHLDFHETMENYMEAKAKLFSQSRHGVINLDDPWGEKILEKAECPVMTFGTKKAADLFGENIRLSERGVIVSTKLGGEKYEIRLGIPGMFSVYNALSATAACLGMGIPMDDILKGLVLAKGVKGRAEVVPLSAPYTVLIDYAHTPDGLENIIKTVRGFAKGRVITMFGCGGDRDRTKRPIMGEVAASLSDFSVVTSDNPRTEDPMAIIRDIEEGLSAYKDKYHVVANRKEAIRYAMGMAREGDVIILAGKGHETYQILKDETIDFDERAIVKEIFKDAGI
ncbi:MAG: UDP-N-acetylmuramoyl-L-alanyl-D-glutamate--2,6-diaminopimelate ligase [Clostridia bacterium]|nr:UDP-N-acetylmuramoyl-L-alanyl-D-glutamate--2,6-diaminopimelate ligase [Clostridia bacterium]